MRLASALYDSFYPFQEMGVFDDYNLVISPNELQLDHCLVVWGGGDISPTLYNKAVSKHTEAGVLPSKRDAHEWALMQRAEKLGISIIGICRGAQMLCALAGGFLIQDATGHTYGGHEVETSGGGVFNVSSLHHQMLYPFEVDHELRAWSKRPLSGHYLDVNTPIEMPLEPEYVYFPKQKGIAIQWHPEYMDVNCKANQYVKQQIEELL